MAKSVVKERQIVTIKDHLLNVKKQVGKVFYKYFLNVNGRIDNLIPINNAL